MIGGGTEVIVLIKGLMAARGVGHAALVGGMAIGSAIFKRFLLKHDWVFVALVMDQIVFLAGGLVFLDLFLGDFAHHVSLMFDLID